MKQKGTLVVQLIGIAVFGGSLALPTLADTPYQGIPIRNVFNLRPATVAAPEPAIKPPASKLTLAGVTDILGRKLAIVNVAPNPVVAGKTGPAVEQKKEHSFTLAEGQRQEGVTILQIDQQLRVVKVDNDGSVETLAFEKR